MSLGWAIIGLGLIAVLRWPASVKLSARSADVRRPASLASVPIVVIVAVAALVCSLSPERTIGTFTFVRPSALLYEVVPMFRAYARFGVVVQLMAALLAGIGVDYLWRAVTRGARIACLVLVALAAGEYAVSPWALWRDVLPTTAHRWVMQQPGRVHALDCAPLDQETESVQWLTGDRVTMLGGSISDCTEPNLPQKLSAMGYTHLLVRGDTDGEESSPITRYGRIESRGALEMDRCSRSQRTPSHLYRNDGWVFPREHEGSCRGDGCEPTRRGR